MSWFNRLRDRILADQLCAREGHRLRSLPSVGLPALPPCATCAADVCFQELLALVPKQDRVRRFKLRFNRRFRHSRLCLHGWCVRVQTYDNRCHRHQELTP